MDLGTLGHTSRPGIFPPRTRRLCFSSGDTLVVPSLLARASRVPRIREFVQPNGRLEVRADWQVLGDPAVRKKVSA